MIKKLKIAGTRPIIIKKVTKSKGKKNIFVKINVFPLTTWSKVWENRFCVTIRRFAYRIYRIYRIQIFLEDRWTDPSLETLKTHV